MRSPRSILGSSLFLTTLAAGGCTESPAAPVAQDASASVADRPPSPGSELADRELASLGDRELMLVILERIDALESRIDTEVTNAREQLGRLAAGGGIVLAAAPGRGQSRGRGVGGGPGEETGGGHGTPQGQGVGTGGTPPGQSGRTPGSGGNGQGAGPPDTPRGVPFQLEAIRERLAALEEQNDLLVDKVNMITVGVGLPVPEDAEVSQSEAFQTSSQVCMNIGTSGNVNLQGKFRTRTEGRGGAGIDFYGNKLLVELRGDATGLAGGAWNIIEGGVSYRFCVNAGRAEAQALMDALPFNSRGFESRYNSLAGDVGTLRTSPFALIDPNFSLFGLESYPSRGALLNRLDGFFGGLRTDLCNEIKGRYDVVGDLELGDGKLGSIVSPKVDDLQSRFGDDC